MPVNGLPPQCCGPGMPGPYILYNRETAQADCDETVKLTEKSGKPLDSSQNGTIINLALGDKEC